MLTLYFNSRLSFLLKLLFPLYIRSFLLCIIFSGSAAHRAMASCRSAAHRAMASCRSAAHRALWRLVALQPNAHYGFLVYEVS
jgi:hypothetical protein